jgi:DEAD/DEAH box helicase domain-containing protein
MSEISHSNRLLADEPIRCLKRARDLLDCTRPGGCGMPESERFCSRCLLSSDTQRILQRCDRRTAFRLLNELIPKLEISTEDRLFGAKTELETTPLSDALGRRIAQASSRALVIWLHGEPWDWAFDEWPARHLAETWGPRGIPIRFVVRSEAPRSADVSARHSLVRLVQRCHTAELVEAIDLTLAGTPLAGLLANDHSLTWASRVQSASSMGADWADHLALPSCAEGSRALYLARGSMPPRLCLIHRTQRWSKFSERPMERYQVLGRGSGACWSNALGDF